MGIHLSTEFLNRTIINYMESGLICTGLFATFGVQSIECVRLCYGPLVPSICFIQSFLRNGPTLGLLLYIDAISIFKCVFIFGLKSFGGIEERFFALFCHILIAMVWIIYGVIFVVMPGRQTMNYYICTGCNPDDDPYQYGKV